MIQTGPDSDYSAQVMGPPTPGRACTGMSSTPTTLFKCHREEIDAPGRRVFPANQCKSVIQNWYATDIRAFRRRDVSLRERYCPFPPSIQPTTDNQLVSPGPRVLATGHRGNHVPRSDSQHSEATFGLTNPGRLNRKRIPR